MAELDRDGDGVVTQEELIAALDKDGDGVIDQDEFMYAVRQGVGQGDGGRNADEFPEVVAYCASLRDGGDLREVMGDGSAPDGSNVPAPGVAGTRAAGVWHQRLRRPKLWRL